MGENRSTNTTVFAHLPISKNKIIIIPLILLTDKTRADLRVYSCHRLAAPISAAASPRVAVTTGT